jgi:hypothetical protein
MWIYHVQGVFDEDFFGHGGGEHRFKVPFRSPGPRSRSGFTSCLDCIDLFLVVRVLYVRYDPCLPILRRENKYSSERW